LLNQALLPLLVPSFASEIGPDIINLFTDDEQNTALKCT